MWMLSQTQSKTGSGRIVPYPYDSPHGVSRYGLPHYMVQEAKQEHQYPGHHWPLHPWCLSHYYIITNSQSNCPGSLAEVHHSLWNCQEHHHIPGRNFESQLVQEFCKQVWKLCTTLFILRPLSSVNISTKHWSACLKLLVNKISLIRKTMWTLWFMPTAVQKQCYRALTILSYV